MSLTNLDLFIIRSIIFLIISSLLAVIIVKIYEITINQKKFKPGDKVYFNIYNRGEFDTHVGYITEKRGILTTDYYLLSYIDDSLYIKKINDITLFVDFDSSYIPDIDSYIPDIGDREVKNI